MTRGLRAAALAVFFGQALRLRMRRHARWRHLEDGGREDLALEVGAQSVQAEGRVLAPSGAQLLGYRIVCDGSWRVRSAQVSGPGGSVALSSDGRGRWTAPGGDPVPALDGCIDLDIQQTPFTNTLAIRRLDLPEGASQTIPVAYIPVPSFRPRPVQQTYTCLRRGRAYRYEGHPPGFAADLAVDGDGLVVAYPRLFQRL